MTLRDKISSLLGSNRLTPWLLAMAVAAVVFRCMPERIDIVTTDVTGCLYPWTQFIRLEGLAAYGTTFSNYSPLYTYILGFISLLPEAWWLYAIKLVSIVADVGLACACGAVMNEALRGRPARMRLNLSCLASAVVLWLPSVWLNSAVWGQCDVLWAGCCVMSLLYLMRGRGGAAMVWYGVAVSFKLQAVFFFPVVFMLWVARELKLQQLLTVPAMYLLTCLPCALMGRRWTSLIGIYIFQQPADQTRWYYNAPSLYYFLRDYEFNRSLALSLLIPIAIFAVWLCVRAARSYATLDSSGRQRLLLVLAAFSGVFFPYVLPMMHERYMYLGDITTLLAAFALMRSGRMWLAALFTQCASVLADCTFLYASVYSIEKWTLRPYSLACSTIAVVLLGIEMYNLMKKRQC